jgi:hypothetical protein
MAAIDSTSCNVRRDMGTAWARHQHGINMANGGRAVICNTTSNRLRTWQDGQVLSVLRGATTGLVLLASGRGAATIAYYPNALLASPGLFVCQVYVRASQAIVAVPITTEQLRIPAYFAFSVIVAGASRIWRYVKSWMESRERKFEL